ncbi:retron system putative HNH endonuclease [Pseudomonas fluvialis]|uniref:HNH endonuclease n=1 Tax=Pseudomonas fluvialis TaxID=1793966 RepID=A0ABQ2AS28_9PSED|nr:retron system putative HNH endonuclease [Pseudomonas fluvialis]GGH95376.1 HNH endonuclease [Pseudomonas fluvialis]HCL3757801.1 TIGR02646 family protein [Pseudomonas aeruginosa]
MIELVHNPVVPAVLQAYVAANRAAVPADFDSAAFQPVKRQVKASLNADQGGLCVYCETELAAQSGQVDHIKPKSGPNAHPHLAFTYSNYAQSCINEKTCGQKKKAGLLPIQPGPGCNDDFSLSTDGQLEPMPDLIRQRKHAVRQTRDMLGLQNAALVRERQRWIETVIELMQNQPALVPAFLADKPFRHILRRLAA